MSKFTPSMPHAVSRMSLKKSGQQVSMGRRTTRRMGALKLLDDKHGELKSMRTRQIIYVMVSPVGFYATFCRSP